MLQLKKLIKSIYKFVLTFIKGQLKNYNSSDFSTQQKAKVYYPVLVVALFSVVLIILTTGYVQLTASAQKINFPVLFTELFLFIILLFLFTSFNHRIL